MKKLFLAVIILLLSNVYNSCTTKKEAPEIITSSVSHSIDPDTYEPIEIDNKFLSYEPVIYFVVDVKNLPKNTMLKASWKYLNDGSETNSELYAGGSGYQVFKLKRANKDFLPGLYEVTVIGTADNINLRANSKFEVLKDSPAVNISTPITSRSVVDEENLNPIDITSEFNSLDKQIYFIMQTSFLPENTTIKCTWQHVDTDVSISNKITTGGSRNIAFYLKCKDENHLPEGKYRVTASAILNNKVQFIQREFEVN